MARERRKTYSRKLYKKDNYKRTYKRIINYKRKDIN